MENLLGFPKHYFSNMKQKSNHEIEVFIYLCVSHPSCFVDIKSECSIESIIGQSFEQQNVFFWLRGHDPPFTQSKATAGQMPKK